MGENRSQTISERVLLKLTAADHNRVLNEGSGLSGKVRAGAKGISVHFRYRYRFQGEPREMTLCAWQRDSLEAIRESFEETKLRVTHGSDPVGRKQAFVKKVQLEQQQHELAEQRRERAEQQL